MRNFSSQPPFEKEHQLNHGLDGFSSSSNDNPPSLPSQPQIFMDPSCPHLAQFLLDDISPSKLNHLAPHLWLCSMPSHTNVPPLHNHAIHGRSILPTEDPALHLVWLPGRIFIKPLPPYILSHAFWTQYLLHQQDNGQTSPDEQNKAKTAIREAALGLLRTYHHSVRHELDFRLAQQSHLSLIPSSITWPQWCAFSASFSSIPNSAVSPRYHYGKIQLSRLNWLVRIYCREMNYYYLDGGYGESFTRYYGPLLFVFGTLSVLLSAMQVGMAVEQIESREWTAFWGACRWFSVVSLCGLAVVAVFLLGLFVVKSGDELLWAVRAQFRARRHTAWHEKLDGAA